MYLCGVNLKIDIMEFRVKELTKAAGMTLEGLANSLGYTRQNLTKTLSNNPTIGTLEKIADALGVEVVELFASNKANAVCPHCGKELHIEIK